MDHWEKMLEELSTAQLESMRSSLLIVSTEKEGRLSDESIRVIWRNQHHSWWEAHGPDSEWTKSLRKLSAGMVNQMHDLFVKVIIQRVPNPNSVGFTVIPPDSSMPQFRYSSDSKEYLAPEMIWGALIEWGIDPDWAICIAHGIRPLNADNIGMYCFLGENPDVSESEKYSIRAIFHESEYNLSEYAILSICATITEHFEEIKEMEEEARIKEEGNDLPDKITPFYAHIVQFMFWYPVLKSIRDFLQISDADAGYILVDMLLHPALSEEGHSIVDHLMKISDNTDADGPSPQASFEYLKRCIDKYGWEQFSQSVATQEGGDSLLSKRAEEIYDEWNPHFSVKEEEYDERGFSGLGDLFG